MVLRMRGWSIMTKVRQGEFTWPTSHQLFTSVSHVHYVSPDSSKKIKDVLAEFNESGSLKQYDSREVRNFHFKILKTPYSNLFIICSPLRSLSSLWKTCFLTLVSSEPLVLSGIMFSKSIHPLTVLEDYIIPSSLSSNLSLLLRSSFSVNHFVFYFTEKTGTSRRDLLHDPHSPTYLFSCN